VSTHRGWILAHKCTTTISAMCRAPLAAPFSGGNTSAEMLVSLSSAKAISPASVKTHLTFMIRMWEQGYTPTVGQYIQVDGCHGGIQVKSDNEVQQLTPHKHCMAISVRCPYLMLVNTTTSQTLQDSTPTTPSI
jgi:hypothetical protein